MEERKTIFPDHADVPDSSWTFEPVEDAVARRSTRQSVKGNRHRLLWEVEHKALKPALPLDRPVTSVFRTVRAKKWCRPVSRPACPLGVMFRPEAVLVRSGEPYFLAIA
jgi:hypothetical protein